MLESQKEAQNEALRLAAVEWSRLTETALEVQNRKREWREILENIFKTIIPALNLELEEAGSGYRFHKDQYAGYTAIGPISFELHPNATAKWQATNKHHGLIDYDRAKELTNFVNESKCVSEFKAVFPHIQISVMADYWGYLDQANDCSPEETYLGEEYFGSFDNEEA